MRRLKGPLDVVDLACRRCGLCEGRTQVVPAEGAPSARLFLVGEAPGPDEDAQGRPFIGRAGKILRACLEKAGVPIEDVWISNAVKCFPNELVEGRRKIRKPTPAESAACLPFLKAELDLVEPAIVVAVGATAALQLTGRKDVKLTQDHGQVVAARSELDGRKVLLTFHPSGLHYGHATPADLAGDLAKAYELALTR